METDEDTWRRAGLDEFDVSQPAGSSDLKCKEYLEKLFADQIAGHSLLVNNSRWASFRTRRAARWRSGNVALLGDAAHTAHFSVGSGTKMAMEDAIALASALGKHRGDVAAALDDYEATARPSVEKIQGAARPSLSWWEHFGRYHDALEPWQFSFHFMSRSITVDRLARRDPAHVDAVRSRWRQAYGGEVLSTPLKVGCLTVPGRILQMSRDGGQVDVSAPGEPTVRLPLVEAGRPDGAAAWGLWFEAPADEAGLPRAYAELQDRLVEYPDLVAVHGGSRLTRTLLSEESRMVAGVPTLLVEQTLSLDEAETLVLSGRADLLATRSVDGQPHP